MTMPKTRALGIIRLSKSADPASTSIERQREIIDEYTRRENMILVDFAEDKATSAFHIPPERRKQIKVWLDERTDEYDCIVYWRQDRLVRRTADFMGIVSWCKAHDKKLYSATEGLGDVTEHAGVLVGFIAAWQAEGESMSTSKRVKSSQERLHREGRWTGGRPAHWQLAVCVCHDRPECPDLKRCTGWKLVINEDRAPVIREAARRVTAGESTNSVVADFVRRGVPSTDGKKGKRWHPTTLRQILRNQNLVDGGLLTPEEWGQLQAALNDRHKYRQVRTLGRDTLTLDLVFCARCGSKIYHLRHVEAGKAYWYGRCKSYSNRAYAEHPCDLPPIRYEYLEQVVVNDIEKHRDDIIETRVTSTLRAKRSEEIDKELASLTPDFLARRITRAEMEARLAELLDEQEALESDKDAPRWHRTTETVGQRWDRLSTAERRLWLLRVGTTWTVDCETDGAGRRRRWVIKSSWRPADDSDEYRERIVRAA